MVSEPKKLYHGAISDHLAQLRNGEKLMRDLQKRLIDDGYTQVCHDEYVKEIPK